MLTVERLLKLLKDGNQYVMHDTYTDEAGLAYFLGCTPRTIRNARSQDLPGRSGLKTRPLYDFGEIVCWYNANLQNAEKVGNA